MRRIKDSYRVVPLILMIAAMSLTVRAQGPGFDGDVIDTPIDGGAAFLLAATAAYGYKKIADKRKK